MGNAKATTDREQGDRPAHIEDDEGEASLVNEFAALVTAPQFLIGAFREMAADRAYVYRDAMLLKTQDTVAVNHVLRNQMVSLAYLGVSDPQPFVQPCRRVNGEVAFDVELFAETSEIHLSRMLNQMDFARKFEGACQDASTNRLAILKVIPQSDFMKDAIGRNRFGDMQEQAAMYESLKRKQKEGLIQPGSFEDKKLQDLKITLKLFVAGQIEEQIKTTPVMVPGQVPATNPETGAPVVDPMTLQPVMTEGLVPDPTDPRAVERQAVIDDEEYDILGCPLLKHYTGFECDQILPEDFRWDWSVTRPEEWNAGACEWMAHRVYMHPDDICAKFAVTREELIAANANARQGTKHHSFGATNSTAIDPNLRLDIEGETLNDRVAVWELWHRKHFRRYVFCTGMRRFLANEVPQAVGRRFFPFFPLYWNRVSGQALAISDVQLVRPLQDEINMVRSHGREYRRACYPVLFVPRGVMDPAAQSQYRNRLPYSVIEVNNVDEVKKYFSESSVINYNAQLVDTSKAEGELQQQFGIPSIVTGSPGGTDVASEIALAKEGMETGVARRRTMANRVITDLLQYMEEISLKIFDEDTIKQTCGSSAIWPRLSSDEIYNYVTIDIRGGLQGQPRSKDRMDLWMGFSDICMKLQLPINGIAVLKEILDAMGLRVDPTRFLQQMPPPGVGPMPGGGVPGMPGGAPPGGKKPPGHAPGTPGGGPPQGGAPPMVTRPAPSSLAQIPNHPPLPMPPPQGTG